jgi:hypothetical protein
MVRTADLLRGVGVSAHEIAAACLIGTYTQNAAKMKHILENLAHRSRDRKYHDLYNLLVDIECHLVRLGYFDVDPYVFSTENICREDVKYLLSYLDKAKCVYTLQKRGSSDENMFGYDVCIYHPLLHTQNGIDQSIRLENENYNHV